MSLAVGYSSSSEDEVDQEHALKQSLVNYAPAVDIGEDALVIGANGSSNKRTLTGTIEHEAFDDVAFEVRKRTFDMLGYSVDEAGNKNRIDITQYKPSRSDTTSIKKKRAGKGEIGITTGRKAYKGPWSRYDNSSSSATDNGEDDEEDEEDEQSDGGQHIEQTKVAALHETTEFYGESELDYQGRTYMHVPRDLDINLQKDPGAEECFVPKRCIHRWEGHAGGTNKIQFLPRSGHLLLSGGNDSKILLYDAHHDRKLLRGFFGHTKAVKDLTFNNSGDKFLSCGYDRYIKQWDTETGKCISKIRTTAFPNVVKYNPNENLQDEFLVGLTNKKIEQYDLRSNEVVQTYDHHLDSINSITFIDNDKKFMTSSDDKSLRIWNWQINIPIKLIADPAQHSMPRVVLHPSGKYVAAQSMNNTIEVIGAQGSKFKRNKKKLFTGHSSSGYGIGINFSPDGKILMSGDSYGYGFFWDWKTCKLVTKLKVDDKLISCIEQNPQEVSKVAMSGLSGPIYYYE